MPAMFYPASDTIATEHPELVDQINSIDSYLFELGGHLLRLDPAADLLDVGSGTLERLLRLYEKHDVVEQVEIFICPEDGEIVEVNEEGVLWCDVCVTEYQPDECEREMAYRVQPGLITSPPPIAPRGEAAAQIFLSYAREDKAEVERLYQKLSDAGFEPWIDTKDILPGEQWKSSIQKAIRRSDFFLACLSKNSVSKRGWIQKEIKGALDMWEEKLDSDIYLIPVRLEDCEVPERLRDFQWVDLFEEDGWTRLVEAIQVGMERRAEEESTEL
jgi:hypothetical protein